MGSFSENLRTKMMVGGFENIYIESFPAPTSISPQIIGIIASGEIFDAGNPEIISFVRRFVITGSAETAFRKAEEIIGVTRTDLLGIKVASVFRIVLAISWMKP